MSLKLGTFPVHRLEIGSKTSWDDGTLTIDKAGLTESAAAVPQHRERVHRRRMSRGVDADSRGQ